MYKAQIGEIFDTGLHQFTDRLQVDINTINTAISRQFFGYDESSDAEKKTETETLAEEALPGRDA